MRCTKPTPSGRDKTLTLANLMAFGVCCFLCFLWGVCYTIRSLSLDSNLSGPALGRHVLTPAEPSQADLFRCDPSAPRMQYIVIVRRYCCATLLWLFYNFFTFFIIMVILLWFFSRRRCCCCCVFSGKNSFASCIFHSATCCSVDLKVHPVTVNELGAETRTLSYSRLFGE